MNGDSKKYFDLIKNAREPPFTVVENSKDLLIDYEKAFENCLQKPKGLKNSEARMIKYFPNKEV